MSLKLRQNDGPQLPAVNPSESRLNDSPPSVPPVAQFVYSDTKTSHASQSAGQWKLKSVPASAQCGHEKWVAPFRYSGQVPQNLFDRSLHGDEGESQLKVLH